jgi:PhnB protein
VEYTEAMDTSTQLSPYLTFNGNCREAMEFYHSVMGGELEFHTFGEYADQGMPVDDKQRDKIMHASLNNGNLSFMASDCVPGNPATFGDNISVSISGTDSDLFTKLFNGLSEGGTVTMPLEKQVWGDNFGMFTDKFGIHWMVNIGTKTAEK